MPAYAGITTGRARGKGRWGKKVNVGVELVTAKKQADGTQMRSVELDMQYSIGAGIANDDGRIEFSAGESPAIPEMERCKAVTSAII
jgi:hypothetical protein